MKKTKQLVAGSLSALLLLSGCATGDTKPAASGTNGGTTASSAAKEAPKSDVTLTISRWAGPHADDQAELLKEFEKETGIKVKMDAIDFGQLKPKQTLNMSGKTGQYDLIWAQESWIGEYVKSGFLAPLDDYVKEAGSKYDAADMNPSAIKAFTVDNKLYGLPNFEQMPLLVYNKEMLQAEGLQPPQTWDDTLKVAKHFFDKGTGIGIPGKQGSASVSIFTILKRTNGSDYFNASGKLELATPANIETMQFWKTLASYSMKGSTTWWWDEVTKALQFGQIPLGITQSGLFSQLEDPTKSKVNGKLGYAPLPYKKSPAGLINVWSWCLPQDSKHPKEAFQLAAWLTSKETEKKMSLKNASHISLRQSLFNDQELVSKAPWLPAVGTALKDGITSPLQANAPKLVEALGNGMSSIITSGADPKEILERVQQEIASQF
ncbi:MULTISPECIES: ABC transporter substrate-binding protein [unclassified Paenibacillus]|uniref:ABC transporter substrate-binding protein n=1 Tax=unclassified Paenibacillus TaxID=185978 RepID=UPI003638AF42